MDREKRKAVSASGGKAAQRKGKAHKFSSQEASAAARMQHKRGTVHKLSTSELKAGGRKGGMVRARMLTLHGRTQCVTDWARELGVSPQSIFVRLYHLGWSVEKALMTPRRRSSAR